MKNAFLFILILAFSATTFAIEELWNYDHSNGVDPYQVLGVAKNASESELKTALRKLSSKYHPDRNSHLSKFEKVKIEDKLQVVNAAYDLLSDFEKRKEFDRYGSSYSKGSAIKSRPPVDWNQIIGSTWNTAESYGENILRDLPNDPSPEVRARKFEYLRKVIESENWQNKYSAAFFETKAENLVLEFNSRPAADASALLFILDLSVTERFPELMDHLIKGPNAVHIVLYGLTLPRWQKHSQFDKWIKFAVSKNSAEMNQALIKQLLPKVVRAKDQKMMVQRLISEASPNLLQLLAEEVPLASKGADLSSELREILKRGDETVRSTLAKRMDHFFSSPISSPPPTEYYRLHFELNPPRTASTSSPTTEAKKSPLTTGPVLSSRFARPHFPPMMTPPPRPSRFTNPFFTPPTESKAAPGPAPEPIEKISQSPEGWEKTNLPWNSSLSYEQNVVRSFSTGIDNSLIAKWTQGWNWEDPNGPRQLVVRQIGTSVLTIREMLELIHNQKQKSPSHSENIKIQTVKLRQIFSRPYRIGDAAQDIYKFLPIELANDIFQNASPVHTSLEKPQQSPRNEKQEGTRGFHRSFADIPLYGNRPNPEAAPNRNAHAFFKSGAWSTANMAPEEPAASKQPQPEDKSVPPESISMDPPPNWEKTGLVWEPEQTYAKNIVRAFATTVDSSLIQQWTQGWNWEDANGPRKYLLISIRSYVNDINYGFSVGRDKMIRHPSYAGLISARIRWLKQIYSRPFATAGMEELLSKHLAGYMANEILRAGQTTSAGSCRSAHVGK